MGAAGRSRVLDFSAFDADAEPVRVRSVEKDAVDGSLIQTFDPGRYAPVELVPDLAAGTAGPAIPAAAPRTAARHRGGRILPAEVVHAAGRFVAAVRGAALRRPALDPTTALVIVSPDLAPGT